MARPVNRLTWFGLWWRSRDFRLLLAGLPALVFGIAGVGLFAWGASAARQDLESRYFEKAKAAFKDEDYPLAMTCYDRLAYREDRADILFGRALAAKAVKQPVLCNAIMNRLEKFDKTPYAPAQMFRAKEYFYKPNPTMDDLTKAQRYLLDALQGAELEDRGEVWSMLGQIYLAWGQLDRPDKNKILDDAEKLLNLAVKTKPIMRLHLAKLLQIRGDQSGAQREAEQAVHFLKVQLDSSPRNIRIRVYLKEALILLSDYPQGLNVLLTGLNLETEKDARQAYHYALGNFYAAWLADLERKGVAFKERIQRMDEGLQYDPTNQLLLKILYSWAQKNDAEAMRRLITAGERSPMVEMALGVLDMEKGDFDSGLGHLEHAHLLVPGNPEIANNLAMAMTQVPKPALDKALALADEAVKQNPTSPNPIYVGTRGHIYCLQENWKLALIDLRMAQATQRDNLQHHIDLVTVYEHLNRKKDAAMMRMRVEDLAASRKTSSFLGIPVKFDRSAP